MTDGAPFPHPLAGKPAPESVLVDPRALVDAYFNLAPDPENPAERVAFGTSGHRGSSLAGSFNEAHILATTQAICEYRAQQGIDGPRFLGKDTHAVSRPAERTARLVRAPGNDAPIGGLEVATANGGFASRPSGTESIYKLYAESFRSEEHLAALVAEARSLVGRILGSA